MPHFPRILSLVVLFAAVPVHAAGLPDTVPDLCTYALSPLDLSNTSPTGGSRNITVTTPAGCPVTATSYQPWVTVTAVTPNGDTTTVALQVSPNGGGATRATSIVVAGRLYLITQQCCQK